MRLFTAVELSEPTRAAIVRVQERVVASLGRGGGHLRIVKPEQLHLTLVFIGDVSEAAGASILGVMADDLPMSAFRIEFAGIGAFPSRGAPRVLYLAVTEGAEAMVRLHTLVADRLAQAGVSREGRPFHPHLTLGRWRDSRPARVGAPVGRTPRWNRPREGEAASPVAAAEVAMVSLMQSRLSASGPAYTRMAAARLVCP